MKAKESGNELRSAAAAETTKALLARWYAGETIEAEERLLRERLHADPEAVDPTDQLLFAGLGALAEVRMPAAQRGAQEERLRRAEAPEQDGVLLSSASRSGVEAPGRAGRSGRRGGWLIGRRWIAATVAAAAMVVIGLTAAWNLRTPYYYIDGVAIYDPERALAATSCLHELDVLSLSDELLDRLLEYDPLETSRTTINW